MKVYPHKENRCAQNHDETEFLEVYITNRCNAKCEWCFDRNSYHPSSKTDYQSIADTILSFKHNKVWLTGGEPMLYKDLKKLIDVLVSHGKKIYITTNGSKLNTEDLKGVETLTISIHHFDLRRNYELTKVKLHKSILAENIKKLREQGTNVRINCTVTKGYLDTLEDVHKFIEFSKEIGADGVRFAEVAYYDDLFVDLNRLFNSNYGLTDEPFVNGCYKSTTINDMPIDIKLSCGALTSNRKLPEGAHADAYKNVVYYDGQSYKGWQSSYAFYEEKTIDNILDDLLASRISKKNAVKYLSLK